MFVRTLLCVLLFAFQNSETPDLFSREMLACWPGGCSRLENGDFSLGFGSCLDLLCFALQIWLALGILWQNLAFPWVFWQN